MSKFCLLKINCLSSKFFRDQSNLDTLGQKRLAHQLTELQVEEISPSH